MSKASKGKQNGSAKRRTAANTAETVTLGTNERILRDCHQLYTDQEKGLIKLGLELGILLNPPKKKITVMLIGNHSAGKSSFINWYIEEHVQKTAVAIETQGFTLITSGKKRESLTAAATLHLYPRLKDLQEFDGLLGFLSTEVSSSKQKHFNLVTFVDTPGLVDGDMKYPFDVEQTIVWLGGMCDRIFVFFDPIGQALCRRTLDIVEKLNANHPDQIFFYLSKADTAGVESDRQRVLMQITQELCRRPGLNKPGLKMPTIFIPSLTAKTPRCENQLEDLCQEIELTIKQNIQNSLNTLGKDAETLVTAIDKKLEKDRLTRQRNFKSCSRGLLFYFMGLALPLLAFASLTLTKVSRRVLESTLGTHGTDAFYSYMLPISSAWHSLSASTKLYLFLLLFCVSMVFLWLARVISRTKPTLSRREKRELLENRVFLDEHVKKMKAQLYAEYLKQCVGVLDL